MYMLQNLLLNLLFLCWILENNAANSATVATPRVKTGSRISKIFDKKTKLIVNHNKPRTYNSTQGPIAYQWTDFLELVNHGHLTIDKTLFIRYVVHHPADVLLIACPSQWGKTTNLRMLEKYLEFEENWGRGFTCQAVYDFFCNGSLLDGKNLRDTFLISEYVNVTENYLSKWPVIFVDFSNVVGSNFTTFRNSLKHSIKSSYEKFSSLVDFLDDEYYSMLGRYTYACQVVASWEEISYNRDQFKNFLKDELRDTLNDTEIIEGLYLLTKMLWQRFDQKVFVLVDEYDSPFNLALLDPNFKKEDRMMAFNLYKKVLNKLLNDNEYMKKSVLTGTFKFNEHYLFPEQKNLSKYDFSNHVLHYFGINELDLKSICQHMGLWPETESEIQRWYNGYSIESLVEPPLNVANLGSVARYFSHNSFNHYHGKVIGNIENLLPELMKSVNFFRKLCHLVEEGSTAIFEGSFSIKDLKTMMKYVDGQNLDEPGVELAIKLLLAAGYLTPTNSRSDPIKHVCIPNFETYHMFGKSFDMYLNNQQRSLRVCYHALIDSFLEFGTNEEIMSHKLEENFSSFLRAFPHFINKGNFSQSEIYESSKYGNEKVVSSLMLWMGLGMNNTGNFHFSGGQAQFTMEGNVSMPKGVFMVGSRGIICELRYGDEYVLVKDMMTRINGEIKAEILPYIHQRFKHIIDFKFIVVQVCQNTSTEIATEIIPALSLKKRG